MISDSFRTTSTRHALGPVGLRTAGHIPVDCYANQSIGQCRDGAHVSRNDTGNGDIGSEVGKRARIVELG
jgi:hypothetical protein